MNNNFYSFLIFFDLHKFIENPFLFLFDTTSNSHIEAIKGLSGTWLVKSFDFTEKQYILYDVFYNLNEMYNVNPPLRINNEIIQFFIKEFLNESTLDFIYLVEYYYYQLI